MKKLFKSLFFVGGFLPAIVSLKAQPTAATTPGSLPGEVVVDNTGTASYSIPLSVPPGTGGTQPDLKLVYNSGAGDGLLGMGWSIGGLSSISRAPQTWLENDGSASFLPDAVDFDGNDRFMLDGQRLVLVSAGQEYGEAGTEYRTEVESFNRVFAYGQMTDGGTQRRGPEYFKVFTKSGLAMEFGNTADSAFIPTNSPNDARLTWTINKLTDSTGNYIQFNYIQDVASGHTGSQQRLSTVQFTGNDDLGINPYNEVEFVYQDRSSVTNEPIVPSYIGGAQVEVTKLLERIIVKLEGVSVWEYRLFYEESPATLKPRITAIQQVAFGSDGPGGVDDSAIKETQISYRTNQAPVFSEQNLGQLNWLSNGQFYPSDVNGDGRTDLIHHWSESPDPGVGSYQYVNFWLSNGQGGYDITDEAWEISRADTVGGALDLRYKQACNVITGDFNGDTLPEILSVSYAGEFLVGAEPSLAVRRRQLYSYKDGVLGDAVGGGSQPSNPPAWWPDTYTIPNWWETPAESVTWYDPDPNMQEEYTVFLGMNDKYLVGDVDGDGVDELVWVNYIANRNPYEFEVYLWDTSEAAIQAGDFFDERYLLTQFDGDVMRWDHARAALGDMDGDGLLDLVMETRTTSSQTNTQYWTLALNPSPGTGEGKYMFNSPYTLNVNSNWSRHDSMHFADVNGDGKAEFCQVKPSVDNGTDLYRYWRGYNGRPVFLYPNTDAIIQTAISASSSQYYYPSQSSNDDEWTSEDLNQVTGHLFVYGNTLGYQYYAHQDPSTNKWRYYFNRSEKTVYRGDVDLKIYTNDGTPITSSTPVTTASFLIDDELESDFANTDFILDDFRFFFHDATGDGRQDMTLAVVGRQNENFFRIYPSNGSTFEASTAYSPFEFQDVGFEDVWTVTDINGNGSSELTKIAKSSHSKYYESFDGPADLMTSVVNGHGEKTDITHETLANDSIYALDTVGAEDFPIIEWRGPRWIVGAIEKDTGFVPDGGVEDVYRTEYTYGGARVHLGGRGFLGFQTFESYDPQTKLSKIDVLSQDYPTTGMTTKTTTYYDLGGAGEQIISRAENDVLFDAVQGGTLFPFITKSIEKKWAFGDGDILDLEPLVTSIPYATVTTRNRFDNQIDFIDSLPDFSTYVPPVEIDYGNIVGVQIEYGDPQSSDYEGSQTTLNVYDNNTTGNLWFLGRLTSSTVTHARPGKTDIVRKSSFAYNQTTGLLTEEYVEPDGNGGYILKTVHTRDDAGNITKTTVYPDSLPSRITVENLQPEPKYRAYEKSRNELQHEETRTYDFRFGSPLTLTGPNGRSTRWEYDAFGRTVSETINDGTSTALVTQSAYAFDSTAFTIPAVVINGQTVTPASSAEALYKVTVTGTQAPSGTTYYDKMGREIRTEGEVLKSAYGTVPTYDTVVKDTGYNEFGQTSCASDTYFLADGPQRWAKTLYDDLGRAVELHVPGSANVAAGSNSTGSAITVVTKTAYDGLTTTQTVNHVSGNSDSDENQKVVTTNNLRGETISVSNDESGILDNTVTYDYDAVGNLLSTTGPGNFVITMEYDLRGNKTEQIDPDMGTWSYQYNALSQLTSQTDAKNQITVMEYDLLGRMTDRYTDAIVNGSGTVTAFETHGQWFYDGTGQYDQLGNLRMEISYDTEGEVSRRSFYYDELGRQFMVLDKILADPNGTGTTDDRWKYFYTDTAYDQYSRVDEVTSYWRPLHLEGEEFMSSPTWLSYTQTNTYDSKSFVLQVSDTENGGRIWWENPVYDAQGKLTSYSLGNGLDAAMNYDPNDHTLQRLRVGTLANLSSVQDMSFDFDQIGNVRWRSDNKRSLTETFSYDRLNRMTGTTIGSQTLSTAYLANGNISSRQVWEDASNVRTLSYTYGNNNHAVTKVTGLNSGTLDYTYDGNGNMDDRGGLSPVTWTSFNKVKRAYDLSGVNYSDFAFDANHSRIRHTVYEDLNANGTIESNEAKRRTLYAGPIEQVEEFDGTKWTTSHTRVYTSYGIFTMDANLNHERRWFHKDHLGSLCEVTDESGSIVESFSFDAWGNYRDVSTWGWKDPSTVNLGTTERGFTGHEMLAEIGLVHMNGRIYDGVLGRFLSADSLIPSADNGQAYNRYSYVYNNPLTLSDPSGHEPITLFGIAITVIAKYVAAAVIVASTIHTFVSVLNNGGSLGDAFKAAGINLGISAASAALSFGVGSIFGDTVLVISDIAIGDVIHELGRAAANGLAQGGLAEAMGGDFVGSFLSSFTNSITSSILDAGLLIENDIGDFAIGLTVSAGVGGASSELSGGKFVNGAVTAAMSYMFSASDDNSSSGNGSAESSRTELGNTLREAPVLGGVLGGVGDTLSGIGNIALGYLSKGFSQAVRGLARTAGNIWALPTTVIGLAYGGVGMIFGATPIWNSQDAILYFTNMPSWMMPTAMSLGHVHVYGRYSYKYADGRFVPNRKDFPIVGEETLHTSQAEILGPLYLPLHLLSMGGSYITSGHTHNNNLLEMGPETGRGPWPWN